MVDTARLPEYSGSIELDGASYSVPLPAEEHYRDLAAWLEHRALAKIERQRGLLSEDVFQLRHEAMMRAIACDVLAPGQPDFDRAMQSLEVRERLLLIVLQSEHPEVTEGMVRRLFAGIVQQAIAARVARSQQQPEAPARADAASPGDRPAV